MEADVVINLPKVISMHVDANLRSQKFVWLRSWQNESWWHMEAGKDPSRFGQMLVETAQAISLT